LFQEQFSRLKEQRLGNTQPNPWAGEINNAIGPLDDSIDSRSRGGQKLGIQEIQKMAH